MRLLMALFALPLAAADYDLLIRNARVIDGTGSPWFRADVGIRDGRIAAVYVVLNPAKLPGER